MKNMTFLKIILSLLFLNSFFVNPLFAGSKRESNGSQIKMLLDSCWAYRTKDPIIALKFGKKALYKIEQNDFISIKPKALNYLGVVYRKLGDLDKSYSYFDQALDFANVLKDSVQIGYSYNNLTDYYIKKASYTIALENVLIAYEIFNKLNNKVGLSYCINYLGEIYIHQGDLPKALVYLEEAAKIRNEINDMRGYSNSITNIGEIFSKQGKFSKAFDYYYNALRINKKIGYKKGTGRVLSLLSNIFCEENNFEKALNNVKGALKINHDIKNKAGQIENLNQLGIIYLRLNNLKLSKKSLEKALLLSRESGHLDQEMLSYLYLSDYYAKKKDYQGAFNATKNYISLKDSIYSYENLGKFADIQTLFETNKKEVENKILKQDVEFEKRINGYFLIAFIIIFVIIILIVILLVSKNKTQNKANNLLKELNSSKDKFFSILAHDLKGPFQGILGYTDILKNEYDSLEKEEVKVLVSSLYSVTRNVYNLLEGLLEWSRAQTGRIEYNPTFFMLSEEANNVVQLLTESAVVKEIVFSSTIENSIKVYADRDMVNTILRNLVANAIKFTNNGKIVKIVAEKRANDVVVSVVDHGIGMSQEEIQSLFRIDIHHTTLGTNGEEGTGVGLILCKELVQSNGGKIWVESEIGKGSKFSFNLPSSKK
jgi:signal transduction histidine kinase